MQTYYLRFTDGSKQACDGLSAYDAVKIAEKLSGKTVDLAPQHKWKPEKSDAVQILPYPTGNMIWQFEHPINGKTPAFCSTPNKCAGCTACPKSPYACTH